MITRPRAGLVWLLTGLPVGVMLGWLTRTANRCPTCARVVVCMDCNPVAWMRQHHNERHR